MTDFRSLEKKQPVKVQGESGKFVFHSATYNDDGSVRSVCVWGGRAWHEKFRHFLPERITVLKAKVQS